MLDREPILASLQGFARHSSFNVQPSSLLEMMKKCLLLQVVVVVAIFHRTIAEQIDPPIPCTSPNNSCPEFSSIPTKNVSCSAGFCICKNGTEIGYCSSTKILHQDNRNAGSLESSFSRPCKINQDCKFVNSSFCNTAISRCECQKGYVFSSNKKVCLKKAEAIDFPCVEETQCLAYLPNTTCQSNGQCNCIPGYHYARDACYKTVGFGMLCSTSEECSLVEGATCTDMKVCGCPAETVIGAAKNRCLPVAREIGEKCVEDVQCNVTFGEVVCVAESCRCQNGYHFEFEINRCLFDRALDENCGNTYDCYQPEDENVTKKAVECVQNACVCAQDFYREGNRCINNEGASFLGSFLLLFLVTLVRITFCSQAF